MSRLAFIAWVLCGFAANRGMAEPANAAPASPNIVYLMADDHGRQAISCYGSRLIQTPNIDRLARDGMRFTEAFATNSICSPSRAVLITGKYNHLCGVERLGGTFDGAQPTFPKLLQQAGYQTAIIGKWHLESEPTGFDYYCVAPGNGGRYRNPLLKEKGQPWVNGHTGGQLHEGYMTDVITDVSLAWLDRRDKTRPFCMMIHHKAPHSPHEPAPRHAEKFQDTVFPEPENLLDAYQGRAPEPVAEQLAWSRLAQQPEGPYQRFRREQFNGDRTHDTRAMYQHYLRNYLRLILAVDENVGRVLDYLEKHDLARNTVVVYTSDNGYFLGEHGFYNKMWMYEEGFHIPLLVRMPSGHGAATSAQIVSMLDIAPTLLDLAGASVPREMQGGSMKPLLLGQTAPWREAFYYHYYGVGGNPADNWIAAASGEIFGLRTAKAKLVCYPKWKGGPFWELFDLAQDPREMRNLIHDPSRQGEVATLKQQLRGLMARYQDSGALAALEEAERHK